MEFFDNLVIGFGVGPGELVQRCDLGDECFLFLAVLLEGRGGLDRVVARSKQLGFGRDFQHVQQERFFGGVHG